MNLLMIDDQPNVLSSLLEGIPWRKMGFTSVFTATSAAAARTILKNNRVDLVLSDIEMPNEDGLSLLSWAREQGMNYECILLTSHADFFYAKQAISLGVSKYIIQPARNEDIIRAVEKLSAKINQEKSSRTMDINRLNLVAQNASLKQFFDQWPRPETLELDPEKLQKILDNLAEKDRSIDPKKPVVSYYFQIRAWHTMPFSMQNLVMHYLQVILNHFPDRESKLLFWSIDENSFFTVLFEMSVSEAEPGIEALYREMTEKTGCDLALFYTESSLSHLRAALDYLSDSNQQFKLEKGPKAVCLRKLTYDPLSADSGSQKAYEQYGRLIHEYIRLHIGDPLTRTELADELHLSPDHVSYIIKSVDNMTCKELITRMKMEHAQDLLRHSRMPIGDVAQKCGYDSFAYFSKVYKDTFGETPSTARGKKG